MLLQVFSFLFKHSVSKHRIKMSQVVLASIDIFLFRRKRRKPELSLDNEILAQRQETSHGGTMDDDTYDRPHSEEDIYEMLPVEDSIFVTSASHILPQIDETRFGNGHCTEDNYYDSRKSAATTEYYSTFNFGENVEADKRDQPIDDTSDLVGQQACLPAGIDYGEQHPKDKEESLRETEGKGNTNVEVFV